MDNEKIVEAMISEYQKVADDYSMRTSLSEYEEIFGLRDVTLKEGYLPSNLPLFLSWRAADFLFQYYNYMHSLLMPQPGSMLQAEENAFLDDAVRERISVEMRRIMSIIRKSTMATASKDKTMAVGVVDDAVALWNNSCRSLIMEIAEVSIRGWNSEIEDDKHSSYSY